MISKNSVIFFSLITILSPLLLAQENPDKNDKDFTYDKDSKSIIPKYLGKVVLIKGAAESSRQGKSVVLKKGSKIYPKDIIQTSEKSFLKIEMVDKTLMTAGPVTKLSFESWIYKTKEDRKGTFNLMTGKMRAHFKVKAKEEDSLKIKVGHVAMGVRGTRIMANKYEQANGTRVSHLATLEGRTNIYDEVKDFEVNHKEGDQYISFLKRDGTILKSTDTKLTDTELQYLKSDDKDSMKYFKPFLKEFNGKEINDSGTGNGPSGVKKYPKSSYAKEKEKNKASWKKTLKKLNGRLKETE